VQNRLKKLSLHAGHDEMMVLACLRLDSRVSIYNDVSKRHHFVIIHDIPVLQYNILALYSISRRRCQPTVSGRHLRAPLLGHCQDKVKASQIKTFVRSFFGLSISQLHVWEYMDHILIRS
jgi:hypothetical protein